MQPNLSDHIHIDERPQGAGLATADPLELPDAIPTGAAELLRSLLEAHEYAAALRQDEWQFAIELRHLAWRVGTVNDVRWLAFQGLIIHAEEVTKAEDMTRFFRPLKGLSIPPRTAFILSDDGASCVRRLVMSQEKNIHETPKPLWDAERRQLWWQDELVKNYKIPSPNQEAVLNAFQSAGWTARIADPIQNETSSTIDPKRRLRDTIKSLNRNQRRCVLRFSGDGLSTGILWETRRK